MFEFKQGTTFIASCSYRENDQITPKSLAGVTITSKIRDRNDNIIEQLVVTILDEAQGLYRLQAAQTNIWPAENLYWDIFEEVGGRICATNTEIIKVIPGQSRNAGIL